MIPTFAALRAVLLNLGFVDLSVASKYHRLEYLALPDTVVLLPPYGEDDIVSPGNLFGVECAAIPGRD